MDPQSATTVAQAAHDLRHDRANDLPGLLSYRAASQPEGLAYVFLHDDLSLSAQLTYGQLHEQAQQLSQRIARLAEPGDRALLVYGPGLEFVRAFWACAYAGVVAVPTPAPAAKTALSRLELLARDAGSRLILTTEKLHASFADHSAEAGWRWLATDAPPQSAQEVSAPRDARPRVPRRSELAYLQYTSGSTSAPRGVMITHANALANAKSIGRGVGFGPCSTMLSWLPHFHDYGLVHGIILPMFFGAPAYLMAPLSFVRRPLRWLEAIARFRITHTGAPNFAYAACVQSLFGQPSWSCDLSSLSNAGCGAEPINPLTLESFQRSFAAHGLASSVFAPAYGLAEATLGATGKRPGTEPRCLTVDADELREGRVTPTRSGQANARTLVSCGSPVEGVELLIVDAESGRVVPEDHVGEILLQGPSVSSGYWNKPEATAAAFGAKLPERPGKLYLRTGDLGFLQSGELFVTGRLKDLLIIRGRNHYPQDIEWSVEHAHPALRVGYGAAFCTDGADTEQLVVVQEVRRDSAEQDLEEVLQQVRKAVADQHDLSIHSAVLIRSGTIPRTTSGKIRRSRCKEMFLAGELDVLLASVPAERVDAHAPVAFSAEDLSTVIDPSARVEVLVRLVRECVGRLTDRDTQSIPATASPIQAGLDSLSAFRLLHDIEAATGVALPPVAVLEAASLQALAERLLRALEEDHAGTADSPPPESPPGSTVRVPTSALQKGVWVAATLAGPNALYNLMQAVRVVGPLHVEALRRALQTLVERHPSLRTSFEAEDGIPYQVVHAAATLSLPVIDARQDVLQETLERHAREPFDLAVAPLLRATLFRLTDTEHVLLLTVHHLVFDGWSQTVLAREVGTLYRDFESGGPPSLPAPGMAYGEFVRWEEQVLSSPAAAAHLRYWRNRLAGFEPTELPADHARGAQLTLRGEIERFRIPPALVEQLKTLARSHDCTLFMVLLAAFQTLLLRYCGRDDVSVGSPIAGRLRSRFHRTIGFFSNTLVMRTDLGGNPKFSEVLARTRATVLEAYEHQEIPTDRLVSELGLTPDLRRNALYPVAFALQTLPDTRLQLEGTVLSEVPLHSETAKCDVWLAMTESDGALAAEIEYRAELFESATIRALAEHFQQLLAGTAAAPEKRLSELPLLSAAERQRILVEWNDTRRDYPLDRGMHELTATQARNRPDAVAVVFDGAQLSGGELDARANRLAHHLIRLGVRRDVPVGVYLERSLELAVAFLAVLKAGGAFMPLDPEYPPERLRLMLQDSAAPVVLTQRTLLERIQARDRGTARWLCLDAANGMLAAEPSSDPALPCSPDQSAYLIYTSGSSGRPKGVLVPHRGLVNHICWIAEQLQLTHFDRVLQKTSISFDASLWEFFAPLLAGATVVLARPGEHRDMAHLVRTLREQRISVLLMVPSALRVLLMEPGLESCRSLRYLLSGGEALERELARGVYRRLPDITLGNFYGPTEASDDATCFELRSPPTGSGTVPVGRPIANTRCHVLDACMQPVPVGVVGEIYIGGAGVAIGYLNQPELTRERFVADPFQPGDRLYRTGDLARYHLDGSIEVVGRADSQVKVRGVRIELGEIEALLNGLPGIRQSVVVARDERRIGKQLHAYVVGERPNVPAIYRELRSRLPAHLVPAAVVPLDELPTLPNGKLDRSRLPAPGIESGIARSAAPRGELEERLAAIWQDVLGLQRVGAEDNFFELGGHSLLATQVISRIRAALRVELPLRSLFESPTVAGLARHVADERARGGHVDEPPIEIQTRAHPLPVSFSQRRMWFVQQLNPSGTAYNMPFSLRLRGTLNRQALLAAMQVIIERHEGFQTTFSIDGGEPVQVIGAPARLPVLDFDMRSLPREKREAAARQVLREQSLTPFDLSTAPLFRFCIVRLDEEDQVVLLLVHHAVCDQWSAGVIARELASAYSAFCHGERTPFEPLPVQYADFAVWQRRYLGGAALDGQLAYWRDRLRGAAPLALPTDKPRPAQPTSHGSWVFETIPPDTLALLKKLCAERGATPFMALLACFKILLARYTAQNDIVVGCPVANRTRVATENLVGTLVNTLAMRTSLAGDPTFSELLARVRETALESFANQDLPFERLVEELADRSASHSPVVQVLFNVPNAPMAPPSLEGLSLDWFDFDPGTAQFDLSVNVDTELFGRIALTYSTDLFEADTARRMLAQYVGLIAQTVANPDRALSSYRLLTEVQRRQILVNWNETRRPFPSTTRTDELIAAQARRTPRAIAISMGERRMSYADLETRANQLAHYLRRHGAEPRARIGICMERSVEMVVALLAVQKCGAAYVPLDPAFPQSRLQFMADDANLAAILTESALRPTVEALHGAKLFLDENLSDIGLQPRDPPARSAGANDPVYVLYTSGSTGQPKGVEVPHRALTNFLCAMRDTPGCNERDTVLSVTTLSFDICGLELYLPLIVGARVELASRAEVGDPARLIQRMTACRPSIMQATPATWRMLIEAGWKGDSRLSVLCGGEALSRELADRLLERCDELWNLYGPTETTIWSTVQRIERNAEPITIGRPIANTYVYVLDANRDPVPAGVAGELYIGGEGVALGYLGRPDLTQERFSANPFRNEPGERLYRTGDLARYRSDGRIMHLGRLDQQVKIRGFRIELGEIEAVLARHPGVVQTVVAAKEDASGIPQLVAYVIPGDSPPTVESLRARLQTRLPAYMMPAHFVFLSALPLTANNKVDLRSLPSPESQADATTRPSTTAPTSPIEIQLTALWRQVLGNDSIGVHDNFFEVGGHSLKAVELFSYIHEVFRQRLPLATLFQAPTIAQLAAVITSGGWRGSQRSLVAIQPKGEAMPLFAVPGIGGDVLVFARLGKLLGNRQPFYGLQARGLQPHEKPFTSIAAAARHYVSEIRSVRPQGPYLIAGTCTGGVCAYEIAQQLLAQGEQVTLVLLEVFHPSAYVRTRKAAALLWPLWFLSSRLALYARGLASLPLREWGGFLKSKARRVAAVLMENQADEIQPAGTYASARVMRATLQAVAAYNPDPYPGSLLHVIAGNRLVRTTVPDTRQLWSQLAVSPSRTVTLPAEDSGHLFVSPHVERVAAEITTYARAQLATERSLYLAADQDWESPVVVGQ